MKRKGLLFSIAALTLAMLSLFSAAAEETGNQPKSAVTVEIGLYKYEIDLGKAVLLEYYGSEKNITVPSSVEYDGVTNKVVRIAGYLYEGQTQLESVVIPDTITDLGLAAFKDCINLKSVTICGDIPYASPAFDNTGSLSGGYTVTFGSGVTTIPDSLFRTTNPKEDEIYAFVKKVILSDTVKTIEYQAFENCFALTDIVWSSNLETIGENAFDECTGLTELKLPEKVKTISAEAFVSCSSLKTVVLPASLKTLRSGAFENCISLTDVTIKGDIPDCSPAFGNTGSLSGGYTVTFENGVTGIPEYIFESINPKEDEIYAFVRKVVMADTVKTVGFDAFYKCYGLKDIVWSNALESIKSGAFQNCTALTEVKLPESLRFLEYSAFEGCSSVETIVLPSSIKKVGPNVFLGCISLKNLTVTGDIAEYSDSFWHTGSVPNGYTATFAEGVTTIPEKFFYTNASEVSEEYAILTKVNLPDSLTKIDSYAFAYCHSLTSISIPRYVKEIGAGAFHMCTHLGKVYYAGSPNEWAAIHIGSDNEPLLNAELICALDDTAEPAGIQLNKKKATLTIGKKLTLKATVNPEDAVTTLTWYSSNKKVATVSSKGVVKAIRKGTAVITVETSNGLKASCKITVKAPLPTKVILNKKGTVNLQRGKTLKLKATLKPEGAEAKLTWSSSNKKVATVSSKGVVKAKKKGKAVIQVKTSNGKTAKITIKVK